MKRLKYTMLLAVLFPAIVQAQYIGESRPWPAAQTADSLAKKADTTAVNELETRLDSLSGVSPDTIEFKAAAARIDSLSGVSPDTTEFKQEQENIDSLESRKIGRDYYKAGENVTFVPHGPAEKLDSVVINSSGGPGYPPYDTTKYDYILGFQPDSIPLHTFSGFIQLGGGHADSTDKDTLIWCIDQLKSSGGKILILGTASDTVWWYQRGANGHDSLCTAGGITEDVIVEGIDPYRTIFGSPDDLNWVFYFTRGSGARPAGVNGAKLIFRSIHFRSYKSAYCTHGYLKVDVAEGNVELENCVLDGSWWSFSQKDTQTGTDTTAVFRDCVFGHDQECDMKFNYSPYAALIGCYTGKGDLSKGIIDFVDSRHSGGLVEITGCDLKVRYMGGQSLSSRWKIVGSKITLFNSGSYEGIDQNAIVWAVGSDFVSDDACDWTNTLGTYVDGCAFKDCGIGYVNGWVNGCTFESSVTGLIFGVNNSVANANVFKSSTTAININSKTGIVCHGNQMWGCTTGISGTPATNTDNNSW